MVEHTDASKSSAERHVKNRSNTNLLTQRQTGGKCIMGNQGTKDWKLTAFFAISLMLIAGLFSDAALAGDGDGNVTVEWDVVGDGNTFVNTTPIPAADTENGIRFTYTADDVNMNGGSVRIAIPNGWKVPAAGVEVQEGTDRLFLVGTPLATGGSTDNDGPVQLAVGGTLATTLKDQRRVTFTRTRDGDYITAIEVKLDSENWDTDATELQITFIDTTVPIPDRLKFIDGPDTQPYASYEFITESKTKRGSFTRLKVTVDNPAPQPRVKVGNIAVSQSGTVKITPEIAYEGQENVNFTIVFKALGPLYDWDDGIDADINIALGNGLGTPQITDSSADDYVSLSHKGSVTFETDRLEIANNDNIIIHIDRINSGDEVRISYKSVTIGALTADNDSPTESAFTVTVSDTPLDADTTGGRTQALEGSGTMKFTNPSNARVEVGANDETLAIKYTAPIALPDTFTLEITVDGIDNIATPLQQGGTQVSTVDGYVTGSGANPTVDVDGTPTPNRTLNVGSDTITWTWINSPFTRANATFTTTIRNVDIQEGSEAVTWTTSINNTSLTNQPVLYIMNSVANAVEFTSSNAASSYSAAQDVESITFMFTAERTIIKDGKVQVSGIP